MNGTRHRPALAMIRPAPLVIAAIAITVAAILVGVAGAGRAVATAPPPTDEPPVTANPFLPEEQNLSDCLGSVERPGCGSEERGGWRQTLVFVIVGVGMAFVFTMVAREVRRSRRAQEDARRDP